MKNYILIDVDTDRERSILFGKSPNQPQPQNKEEAAEMILNDIACLSQALTTLILMADHNKYGNKTELVNASVRTLTSITPESLGVPDGLEEESKPVKQDEL